MVTLSRFKDGFPLAEWCEQSLGLFQIKRIEVLCEPAVYRSEQITGLLPLALTAPEPRHAHRVARFPGFGLLLTCYRKSTIKIRFCLFWIQEAPGTRRETRHHQHGALIWPITHLLN